MSVWITNATLAIGVVGYLATIVPALQAVSPALVALAVLWVFVVVSLLGVHTGGRVQVVTTALKLVPMAAIILLGVWILVSDPGGLCARSAGDTGTLQDLMAASTIALFAMLGIESATVPAGRVHDPERTIPRATMAGTLLTAAIYVAVSTIAIMLIPQPELASRRRRSSTCSTATSGTPTGSGWRSSSS